MDNLYDVIIIGSGPAGLTAGIYTSRANLKTLIIAGNAWGGQLMLTSAVENYPGFPDGIQGPDLMANMRKQAEKFGVTFLDADATGIDVTKEPFVVNTPPASPPNLGGESKGEYIGRAIIIATGAEFKWLGVPGEKELIGRGVSSCATCDAAFFKDKKVVVVGGGDAAMEEALVLAKYASEVTIVHRRDTFRASQIMQDRVLRNPKIKVLYNKVVTEVVGEEKVTGVRLSTSLLTPLQKKRQDITSTSPLTPLQNFGEGNERGEVFPCDGVFVAIGHTPATKIFEGKVDLDEKRFVKPHPESLSLIQERDLSGYKTMTNIEGVFVAGDVHDYIYKQAITAAGYGCEAALEAEKWLEENK